MKEHLEHIIELAELGHYKAQDALNTCEETIASYMLAADQGSQSARKNLDNIVKEILT